MSEETCSRLDDTLLDDDIEEDLEPEVECLTFTVPRPTPMNSAAVSTEAWQELMRRMQGNQKKPLVTSKTNKKAATKSKGKGTDSGPGKSAAANVDNKLNDNQDKTAQSKENLENIDQRAPKLRFMSIPECDDERLWFGGNFYDEPALKRMKAELFHPIPIKSKGSGQHNDNEIGASTDSDFARPRKIPKNPRLQHHAFGKLKPEPPAQLFSIFTPKKSSPTGTSTNSSSEVWSFKSQHNFNHVVYDYPEIQDGWNTPDKTVVTLRNGPPAQPTTANGNGNKQKPRSCPFYKMIPGTKFAVDAFSYGVIPGIDVYFLSHFHSDHYMGLTKKFSGTIVCTRPTGNLAQMKLGIAEDCIRKLELNKVYVVQGTEVVLIEANHCPGSVIFLFRLPNGQSILHTGDFRYCPDIFTSPFVKSLGRVSTLYLDTTYCDPRYDFPSQAEAVNQVIVTVQKHLSIRPRTLILCGAYCIGKERVFFSLAEAINTKVYCAPAKFKMLTALGYPAFDKFMKPNEEGCQVHVVGMQDLNPSFLSEYLSERSTTYNNIVAIRPSGWEFSKSGKGFTTRSYSQDTVTIIGVPYSEHSSFSELRDFVKHVKPTKVQPTVNVGNESKRNSMMKFIDQWMQETRQ